MSVNPEIAEARKQLEILKQREKELEDRLSSTDFNSKSKLENKRTPRQNRQPMRGMNFQGGENNFEDFFYRETSSHNYNELANSIYVKDTTIASIQQEIDDESDDDDDEGKPRTRPRVNKTQDKGLLISLSDDEDIEIMQVFRNDEGSTQDADLLDSFEHFDGIINDIVYEESENEELTNVTDRAYQQEAGNGLEELQLLSNSTTDTNSIDKQYNFHEDQSDNSSEEDDYTTQNTETSKKRSIQQDIEESLKREHDLQFQRGSFEKLDQISESDSEYENFPIKTTEHTRDKIMREIEEVKLREIELHGKYKEDRTDQSNSDDDEESAIENVADPRKVIALEIQELRKREEELRMNHSRNSSSTSSFENYTEKKSDDENDANKENEHRYIEPRERIEYEMRQQQEREVEITRLHRSLSNENLLLIDDFDEDNSQYENETEELDTRGKILREMEDLKLREREIRGSSSQAFDAEYDIVNTNEKTPDVTETIDIRGKIHQEINDLQQREEELKKHYQYKFNETQSFEIISPDHEYPGEHASSSARSLKDEYPGEHASSPARSLKDTDKKKFGSREDLVAFFGSNSHESNTKKKEKTKNKPNKIRVKIPEAFMSYEKEGNMKQRGQLNRSVRRQEQSPTFKRSTRRTPNGTTNTDTTNIVFKAADAPHHEEKQDDLLLFYQQDGIKEQVETSKNSEDADGITEPYFHDEMKPMKTSKKKLVFRRKSIQNNIPTKGFVSQDIKKEERKISKDEKRAKQMTTDRRQNIHPIAAKWEKKGDEERQRKLAIEYELQKKKEDRIKYLEEKAEQQRNTRLLQEEENNNREKKEEELRTLKIKQQGLNQLWVSKKPLVTEQDNPAQNDQHLHAARKSKQHATSTQNKKDVEPLGGSVAIMKKIKKWEKIAKRSNAQ